MTPVEAARILGVPAGAEWRLVRLAYHDQIRSHHPDRAGSASSDRASRIIEAYRVLEVARAAGPVADPPTGAGPDADPDATAPGPAAPPPPILRVDADTIALGAPAEESFRLLLDAAHDIGEITYVDRSMPIMEVLCRFEGEPATSLLVSLQGRATGTDALCSVESIEDRPAPPAGAVVDLLELALHRRLADGWPVR